MLDTNHLIDNNTRLKVGDSYQDNNNSKYIRTITKVKSNRVWYSCMNSKGGDFSNHSINHDTLVNHFKRNSQKIIPKSKELYPIY